MMSITLLLIFPFSSTELSYKANSSYRTETAEEEYAGTVKHIADNKLKIAQNLHTGFL